MELMIVLIVALQVVILAAVLHEKGGLSRRSRHAIVDTCALIDGRVLELAKHGFIPRKIIIPQFIVDELQGLADGSDHQKRQRARYGIDVISDLRDSKRVTLQILDVKKTETEVDASLVALALKRKGALFTTDYNLQKVAELKGVDVLNVNQLAQSLRPIVLPGEDVELKIVQKGAERTQGVGYLDDGTMVVVDNASTSIGKTVKATVTRNLQTTAGRMLFGQMNTRKRRKRKTNSKS